MPHLRRPIIHASAVLALAVILTGCSTGSHARYPVAGSSDTVSDTDAANEEALLSYVEAERATIPTVLATYPGLYSTMEINGSLKEQDGTRGLPAGTYSVVFYDYTYAAAMDWSLTMDALDGQAGAIDTLCDSTLFPAMKKFGVTGPMSVVYSYGDGRSKFGSMWSHTCSDY